MGPWLWAGVVWGSDDRSQARKRCQDWWNGANLMGHGAHGVARVVACKRVVLAHDWRGVCVHE